MSGKVGVVGFCFGGGMANTLAVRLPEVIDAKLAWKRTIDFFNAKLR